MPIKVRSTGGIKLGQLLLTILKIITEILQKRYRGNDKRGQ